MRDWHAYALAHLDSLPLAPGRKLDVALELGEHLAEFYAELRSRGIPEERAFFETCAQAGDWEELCRGIYAATKEESMLDRMKQIWGPAIVTFVFAYSALMFLEVARNRGLLSHASAPRSPLFYLPWFLLLPFVGAASAYMSRRARGDGWRVYLAASFPVLVLGLVFLVLFASVVAMNPQRLTANPTAFVFLLFDWVVLPSLALCAGVALQGLLGRRTATQ